MRDSLLAAILRSTVRIEVDLALCQGCGIGAEKVPEVARGREAPEVERRPR